MRTSHGIKIFKTLLLVTATAVASLTAAHFIQTGLKPEEREPFGCVIDDSTFVVVTDCTLSYDLNSPTGARLEISAGEETLALLTGTRVEDLDVFMIERSVFPPVGINEKTIDGHCSISEEDQTLVACVSVFESGQQVRIYTVGQK